MDLMYSVVFWGGLGLLKAGIREITKHYMDCVEVTHKI